MLGRALGEGVCPGGGSGLGELQVSGILPGSSIRSRWVQMGDSDRGFLESVLETLPLRSNSSGNEHRLANTWH